MHTNLTSLKIIFLTSFIPVWDIKAVINVSMVTGDPDLDLGNEESSEHSSIWNWIQWYIACLWFSLYSVTQYSLCYSI